MKGLKLEPGWRQACETWLNLFLPKSKPPTSAVMAPVRGSMPMKAPSTSGSCVISQVFLGVLATRITAPRRILMLGGAFAARPDCAGLRPSPEISKASPLARTAVTSLALASSTTAEITSPLSGCSARASSTASSISFWPLAGRSTNFSGPRYT
ncbi:hypothetical protein D9M72_543540 [compost metagenome]